MRRCHYGGGDELGLAVVVYLMVMVPNSCYCYGLGKKLTVAHRTYGIVVYRRYLDRYSILL